MATNNELAQKELEISKGILQATAGKYLTFELGNESYGVEILKVHEIIGMMKIACVPRTPDYVKGVINLRGKVLPVISLRAKFGLEKVEEKETNCIIVIQIGDKGKEITVGLLVDEVKEVLNVTKDQIEPPPSFGGEIEVEFISGIGKVADKVIMFLDVNKIFQVSELSKISVIS